MGLFRLTADKVAYIFGVRVTKRLRVKLSSVLEKRQRALSSACRPSVPQRPEAIASDCCRIASAGIRHSRTGSALSRISMVLHPGP
jgi:hypothetical protein